MQTIQTCHEIINNVLADACAQGAQMASCIAGETATKEFNADANGFSLMRTLYGRTVSVTTYKDGKKGTASINSFDDEAVKSVLSDALLAAESADSDDAWEIADTPCKKSFTYGTPEPDTDRLFARTKEFMEDLKERFPKINIQELVASHESIRRVYGNSHDVRYETVTGFYSMEICYVAAEGDLVTGMEFAFIRCYDLDTPFIDCAQIAKELADTESRLHPRVMEGKFAGTAVLAPGCVRDLVDIATVVFAGDTSLLNDTSIWRESLEKEVASPALTIAFCPLDERIVGGARYTEEGYLSEDYTMIDKGVLKSFRIAQYTANKTGLTRSANDTDSMIIPAGDEALDDIIAGIEKGILVRRFSGGRPDAGGEFSGIAKSSQLIENGKITGPVTEVMISGNLADLLKNLRAASKEVMEDGYGSLPYLAFDGITVSGK